MLYAFIYFIQFYVLVISIFTKLIEINQIEFTTVI